MICMKTTIWCKRIGIAEKQGYVGSNLNIRLDPATDWHRAWMSHHDRNAPVSIIFRVLLSLLLMNFPKAHWSLVDTWFGWLFCVGIARHWSRPILRLKSMRQLISNICAQTFLGLLPSAVFIFLLYSRRNNVPGYESKINIFLTQTVELSDNWSRSCWKGAGMVPDAFGSMPYSIARCAIFKLKSITTNHPITFSLSNKSRYYRSKQIVDHDHSWSQFM